MCIDNDCDGIKEYALIYADRLESLQSELTRLRAVEEAMKNIKSHMEFVSPTGFHVSSVWVMADKALSQTKKGKTEDE